METTTAETVEIVDITFIGEEGMESLSASPQELADKVNGFISDDDYWVYNGPSLIEEGQKVDDVFIAHNAGNIVITNALTGG